MIKIVRKFKINEVKDEVCGSYPKEEAATPLPDKYKAWKPIQRVKVRLALLTRTYSIIEPIFVPADLARSPQYAVGTPGNKRGFFEAWAVETASRSLNPALFFAESIALRNPSIRRGSE